MRDIEDLHASESFDNMDCTICLESLSNTDHQIIKLKKCGHSFHVKCIKEWKKSSSNNSCPLCRKAIRDRLPSTNTTLNTNDRRDRTLSDQIRDECFVKCVLWTSGCSGFIGMIWFGILLIFSMDFDDKFQIQKCRMQSSGEWYIEKYSRQDSLKRYPEKYPITLTNEVVDTKFYKLKAKKRLNWLSEVSWYAEVKCDRIDVLCKDNQTGYLSAYFTLEGETAGIYCTMSVTTGGGFYGEVPVTSDVTCEVAEYNWNYTKEKNRRFKEIFENYRDFEINCLRLIDKKSDPQKVWFSADQNDKRVQDWNSDYELKGISHVFSMSKVMWILSLFLMCVLILSTHYVNQEYQEVVIIWILVIFIVIQIIVGYTFTCHVIRFYGKYHSMIAN